MQGDEARYGGARLAGVVLGVVLDGLLDLPVRLVGDVVGEDVEDEALLYGLAHGVEVERDFVSRGLVVTPEHLQGTALGRGGEREEAQVLLLAAGRDLARERLLGRVYGLGTVPVRLLRCEVPRTHAGRPRAPSSCPWPSPPSGRSGPRR